MKKKQIDKLLSEAKKYREKGDFSNVVALLHQIVESSSDNLIYRYLLAATYFEAGREDEAKKYAAEIITEESDSKEALELSGLICKVEWLNFLDNDTPKAKKCFDEALLFFNRALDIDADFHNARMNLINLYREYVVRNQPVKQEYYKEIEKHCTYMLANRDTNRDSLSRKEKERIYFNWYASVSSFLKFVLFSQHKYKEIIPVVEDYVNFATMANKKVDLFWFINEYGTVYKAYYLSGDMIGLDKFKKELQEKYPDHNFKESFEYFEKNMDTP